MKPEYFTENIWISGKRTGLRLEKDYWVSRKQICALERTAMGQLCSELDQLRETESRASSVRVFALLFFREAAKMAARKKNKGQEFIAPGLNRVLREYSKIG